MSNYSTISIRKTMENIAPNQYLLPAIQRKFVWRPEQIEMLFDSIMRHYPINSFMLWHICDNTIKQNYKFYQFIKDYADKFLEDNPDAPSKLFCNDFWAVIDGQQRMTSLYIGLNGSYRYKRSGKFHYKLTEENMPTRYLYLDISQPLSAAIDNEKEYNFKFKTETEVKNDHEKSSAHWFKVGDILKFNDLSDIHQYLCDHDLIGNKFALKTLSILLTKINNEELINYYKIEEQDQDKVLNIFIRTNSGGTELTFSDLLMSIATANWTRYDVREEMKTIKEEIRSFGNPCFDVSQDFILKTLLVLSDGDVRYKIENFGKANIEDYETKWKGIRTSLVATFQLLAQLGFNDSLLRAKNAAIPIAYYIYKNNLASQITKSIYSKNDKQKIAKWLTMSLLKGMFGGQSDGVLKSMRDVIAQNVGKEFPLQEIIDSFKGNVDKNYSFDNDTLEALLEEQYKSATCGLVLMLLYPDVVLEHGSCIAQDHMHPKTMFIDEEKLEKLNLSDSQKDFFKNPKYYNSVLNLQLLEELVNISKSDEPLNRWAIAKGKNHQDLLVKQSTSLDIQDFEAFIQDRKECILEKFKEILEL